MRVNNQSPFYIFSGSKQCIKTIEKVKKKNYIYILRAHKLFPRQKPVGHELSGSDGDRLVSHLSEKLKNSIVD